MVARPLVIAHRGASAYEPENTLRAIRKALEFGADMVEVDVRISRDGYLVLIHDSTVDRTTNGIGLVCDLTFDELRKLDAGLGERIPVLEEAIQLVKDRGELVVEIKVPGIEDKVVQTLKKHGFKDHVIVTSFYHPVVKRVKNMCPSVKTGVIFASHPIKPLRLALDARSDSLFPKLKYVDDKIMRESHKYGLKVFPWSADTVKDIKYLTRLSVDGIITNKPDLAKRVISHF